MRTKILLSLSVILFFLYENTSAQYWTNVGNGLNNSVFNLSLYNGDLLTSGTFTLSGPDPMNKLAYYDGASWHAFDTAASGLTINCLLEFDDTLYAGVNNGIYYWDSNAWINIPSYNLYDGYYGSRLIRFKDQLYYSGMFSLYRLENDSMVKVGESFDGGQISEVVVYKDKLYLGGCFSTFGGVYSPHFVCFDGTSWSSPGFSIASQASTAALTTFNGSLYIGGSFSANNYLMKYDGTTVDSTFEQPDSWVSVLDSINGKLFMQGNFTKIGTQDINGFGTWDGASWTDISAGFSSGYIIYSIIEYNSAAYIGGDFTYDDGIHQASNVAMYYDFTAINDIQPYTSSVPEIFPNPCTGSTTFLLPVNNKETNVWSIYILDVTGRVVQSVENISHQSMQFDITDLMSGTYLYSIVSTAGKRHTGKLIVK